MYCIKCGVKLADTETICPLCETKVFHPDISREKEIALYPEGKYPAQERTSFGLPIFLTVFFLLPLFLTLACDLRFSGRITWSGYVLGALLLGYQIFVLPTWFRRPNPVVFIPCAFVGIGVYLFYINAMIGGEWFLSLAFPITGYSGLIVTAVTALLRYLQKGRFYVVGGAVLSMGGLAMLSEFLLTVTFETYQFVGWSLYTMISLCLIGGYLIFLGICKPARTFMQRKFFV